MEVLDRVLGLGDRVAWVRGNADRELVTLARGGTLASSDAVSEWAAAQLSADHVDRLAQLPHPVTLTLDGFGEVVFCHGTPRDDAEIVLVDTPLERWAEVLAELPQEARTVVRGHTHMPFVRLAHGRQIINPDSVGMPYGRPGAHWALLADGAVSLRRSTFDADAACAAISARSSYPDVAEWADYVIHARASDAEAIKIFSGLAGTRRCRRRSPFATGESHVQPARVPRSRHASRRFATAGLIRQPPTRTSCQRAVA